MNKHRFVWHDLNTKDLDGSKKFYGEVFQWTFDGRQGPHADDRDAERRHVRGDRGSDRRGVRAVEERAPRRGRRADRDAAAVHVLPGRAVHLRPGGGGGGFYERVFGWHWLPYVHVDSADAASARATRLGAKLTVPPTDIPNVGRFACWLDPQQAAIAVLQPA